MYVFIFVMSNLNNINTKLRAEGHKHKRAKVHPVCRKNISKKVRLFNLPTDSQSDPTETLDVGPPISIAHKFLIFFFI